ncbi:hypothetical protein EI164_05090 [Psychrobacter sp. FME13]|uniref:hypothetical protein n=1 Tax=Psychrobacter TaxID=497 RepID=UPI001788038F|nr:hypothetical protein [Psychrobacter sp. FME13]MBE0441441.1 hypothetical protein [Psychrobacter sp. FME13]
MSTPNIQDILTSPRAQKEFERLSAILDNRNSQLHATEQQLTYSEQKLKKAVKSYRRLLCIFALGVGVLLAMLGGAA